MAGLFGKKQTINNTENKIGALRIQNSSQGLPVPIVFGTTRLVSNLLWFGDFTAIPHTESQKSGGKGGGGTTTNSTTYTYTCAAIFGLCEGPVSSSTFLGVVWSNKDVTTATKLALSQFQGTYTQVPWSYLTTNHANQALNYRGDCYAAASAFDLGSNDGLPNLSFEVTGLLGSGDRNPADVLTSMLTDDKFGAGWPSAHLGNLTNFHDYCAAAGFLVAPAFVAQTPMSQILADLVQVGNAGVIWSDDLLKIVPYADTSVGSWSPDLTVQYQLGYSDFICAPGEDPVKVDRKRQSDAYNAVKLECLDRSNQYNTYLAEAKDQLAIDLYGLRPLGQISAHAICNANIGRTVAQAILQRELYVRNLYSFTLSWRYARLEPMDIVGLTDAALGLVQQAVRITTIEEDENGFLHMTAEELNIGVGTPGSYASQTTGGATPSNNNPPGNAVAPVMFQPPIALSGTPQIWLGTAGGPDWGGAEVWASADGTTYQRFGAVLGPARFGVLTANFALGTDPDTTHALSVNLTASGGELTAGSNEVANALGTLSYLSGANAAGDELIAYSSATLTGAFNYTMGPDYIRRAQAGSTAGVHLTGSKFMRLDAAVGAFDVPTAYFGTTIFVKLLSYNTTGGALQALTDVSPYTFNVVAQVVTSASGYPYYADRSSTANTPAVGYMRFNNASQALSTAVYFNTTTALGANVSAFFTSVGSAGFLDMRDPADTGKWATFTIAGANQAAGVQTFNVVYKAGGAEFPNGDTVVATFSPTPPTGVTSLGLSMPATFIVANSPVTGAGTIAVQWANVAANLFLAGPSTGNAAAPAFRAMGLADIPTTGAVNGMQLSYQGNAVVWAYGNATGGGGGGGIGSIGLNMPAIFTVANSPLTANGTFGVSLANQAVNVVFAGPSSGNAAAPTFRALVAADVPFTLSNPMTAAGDSIIGGANGVPTRLPGGTNGYVMTMVANAPAWAPASGGNGGGGNGTTKVTASNVALGAIPALQTTFNYTTVPTIAARGLVSLLQITHNLGAGNTPIFDIYVRGTGNAAGSLWLSADSVQSNYTVTLPIYYENDAAAQDFFVGIRNRTSQPVTFTLANLRVEKFA